MDPTSTPRPRLTVGAVTETTPRERRVALDPAAAHRLVGTGRPVLVESGAGTAADFTDDEYRAAGATVTDRADVVRRCDLLAVVRCPDDALVAGLHRGQTVLGLVDPLDHLQTMRTLAAAGVTTVAFEMLPRTLSRAQAMDALSSQSSAAGYRAAIVAAESFGRYLSMMITASGTATPAAVLVIGTGVAGLQAIATARRLGAVVTGYDVRAASRGEVESLGATFLTSSVTPQLSAGGYAAALTPQEQAAQQAELAAAIAPFDVVITTAKVPGHRPPVLVPAETVASLRRGSVCIDLGSGDQGGNVAGSIEGVRVVTAGGVTIVGAGELAGDLPTSSSQMYARNVVAMIGSLAPHGGVVVLPDDEIHTAVVVTHDGRITNAAVTAAIELVPAVLTAAAPLTARPA